MKLKKEFKDFYEEIRIDTEVEDLIEKREVLERNFKDNFPKICNDNGIDINKSDIRAIDQGSYKLNTTIKSKYSSPDRDVAIMFPLNIDENNDPIKIKKFAKQALEITNIREPIIKEPCINVSYKKDGIEYLHVDLPLYAQYNDKVYLARGKNSDNCSWEEADPDGLNEYFLKYLRDNGQLRRIVRYLKKWKQESYKSSTNDNEVPPSIGLTLLVCECFEPAQQAEEDDLYTLYMTVKNICNKFDVTKDVDGNIIKADIKCDLPTVPYSDVFFKLRKSDNYLIKFYKRLNKACGYLEDAYNLESEHDAAIYVKKVLGDEFEVPDKDVEDVNTKNHREHGFG